MPVFFCQLFFKTMLVFFLKKKKKIENHNSWLVRYLVLKMIDRSLVLELN